MNPLFQKQMNRQGKQPTLADFRSKLAQVDDNFLLQMEEQARKQGISEAEIQQGKNLLNLIRNGRAY